jgi:hypothetical protein
MFCVKTWAIIDLLSKMHAFHSIPKAHSNSKRQLHISTHLAASGYYTVRLVPIKGVRVYIMRDRTS